MQLHQYGLHRAGPHPENRLQPIRKRLDRGHERPVAAQASTAPLRRTSPAPAGPHPDGRSTRPAGRTPAAVANLRAVMQNARATQGRARQFWNVFETSRVPMTVVDNQRWHLAANQPARLLFRLSLAEIQRRQIDDVTPPHLLPTLDDQWARLMTQGVAGAPYKVRFPDQGELTIVYCALANVLPGLHLIVFVPADWPEDVLIGSADGGEDLGRRALSHREREVLGLIAAGHDRQEIADELTISVATVRTHVRNLLRKLGARNRAHAIALAMQQGLLELPPPHDDPPR